MQVEPLIDFMNHGSLPYTGRDAERERIDAFWRSTLGARELRGALLVGEAGIGKSRLLEEFLPVVLAAGGAAVHVKLHPESTTSLVPLVAQSLWYSEAARNLLKSEPEPSVPAVVGALRRLSRLRPTLLVIEDIHLLSGESIRELSNLLGALADEILSLLCLARPVELEARPVLERFLVEEIELRGLGDREVAELWLRLFGNPVDDGTLRLLGETTRGNPLALRSALRSAIRSQMITRDERNGSWRLKTSAGAFTQSIERNVGFLAEGMAVHLSDEEKQAAGLLAALGEVFSREAALAMTGAGERMLDRLVFKGIIVTSRTSVSPLADASSNHLLFEFTHTLLHQYLTTASAFDPERLMRAVSSGLPLYSVVPFQFLARHGVTAASGRDDLAGAIDRAIRVCQGLDTGPDWTLAMEVWECASALFESSGCWSEEERTDLRARLLRRRLALLRRRDQSEEYRSEAARMLELTAGRSGERFPEHRLAALTYHNWSRFRAGASEIDAVWGEVEALAARHPRLAGTEQYITYLSEMAHIAAVAPDPPLLRRVEEKMTPLVASPETDERIRALAMKRITPHVLLLFDSAEELESRLRLLAELETSLAEKDERISLRKIGLFESIGRTDELVEECRESRARFSAAGLGRNVFYCSLIELTARAAIGGSLRDLRERIETLCAAQPEAHLAPCRRIAGIHLAITGLLRGDAAWTRDVVAAFAVEPELWPEQRVLLASAEELPALAPAIADADDIGAALRELILSAAEDADAPPESAARAIAVLLDRPILRKSDLLTLHAALSLAEAIAARNAPFGEATARRIRSALSRGLAWLAERSLAAFISPLLDRHGHHLPKRETALLRSAAAEALRSRGTPAAEPDGRIGISMLGTIEVHLPGREPEKLKAPRLCVVLGLLVADRMLGQPLELREFRRIAAGEEEPELARKSTNQAVLRLRDLLGVEAILTGRERYELNLELVRADLIEAHLLLSEVHRALRDRSLIRAVPALLDALAVTGGEVPFPGLYDEIFEALREDFENRQRSAVIDVSRGLLREGDTAGAEEVLRAGFKALPEDEEIADLLREALLLLGRRTEAERVRMKAEAIDLT